VHGIEFDADIGTAQLAGKPYCNNS
jgi:hypothetical protein